MAKKLPSLRSASTTAKRTHSLNIFLNDREYKAILDHCEGQHIHNRSSWIRSVIMAEVLRENERNSPMLFEEDEMR